MTLGQYRFDRFTLDLAERQLRDAGAPDAAPVELSGRYLDALALMVAEPGKLIAKDRFMAEVWRGIPVTDEALTQCIRSLRKALGDDAARPRFIETVPKYGYRFIGVVALADAAERPPQLSAATAITAPKSPSPLGEGLGWGASEARNEMVSEQLAADPSPSTPSIAYLFLTASGGAMGGALAGLIGGITYGLMGLAQAMGEASALMVMIVLCVTVGLIGGGAVALGILGAGMLAKGSETRIGLWAVIGGAVGGMMIGALAKLIGTDVFTLLLGKTPGDITGGVEGMMIGGAVGLGLLIASRLESPVSPKRAGIAAALCCAAAGEIIVLIGGRLMAGSLFLVAENFPASRLRFDGFGALFGENGFGLVSQMLSAGVEAALFGGGMAAGLVWMWGRVKG